MFSTEAANINFISFGFTFIASGFIINDTLANSHMTPIVLVSKN
jgi:hypothetical protein